MTEDASTTASASDSVLLVDDDHSLRSLLAGLLESRGITVHQAATFAAGQEILEARSVHVAVVDGLLPDGNGRYLIEHFKTLLPETHWIFISAFWSDPSSIRAVTDSGADLVLRKPFAPDEFLAHVEALLGREVDTTGPTIEPAATSRLEAAKKRYQGRLPEKFEQLGSMLGECQKGAGLAPALRLAHSIHGTAGTFRCDEASQLAGWVEKLLRSVDDGRVPLADVPWKEIDRRLHTFTITSKTDGGGFAAPQTGGPGSATTASWPQLLAVDDDLSFLDQLRVLGTEAMVCILPAANRAEALEVIRRRRVDGVLLDLDLGADADPLDIVKLLRTQEGFGDLPVVILSGHDTIEHRMRGVEIGAALFLKKPITRSQLREVADRLAGSEQQQRGRILVVDDEPAFCQGLTAILEREGFEAAFETDPTSIFEALAREQPDLLIVDTLMPKLSGFDVCRLVRSAPEWMDLPIIVATAFQSRDLRLTAYDAGADDYLAKPIVRNELLARIQVRLERSRLLRHRAERDTLTGLLLRRSFINRLEAMLSKAQRDDRPVAVALLDVDSFKSVNDRFGHALGDRVLGALGRIFTASFRTEDQLCRWGGEEFAMAFNDIDAEGARIILDQVRSDFEAMQFTSASGDQFSVSFSGGVAEFPAHGTSVDGLIQAADSGLYRAKAQGRGRIVVGPANAASVEADS